MKLKFKIWDNILKKFLFNGEGCAINECVYEGEIEYLQFTGLLDCEGKEIYCGDVVRAEDANNKYLSVAEWNDREACWGFKSIINKNMQFEYNLTSGCSRWTVVGNIFENKDLL